MDAIVGESYVSRNHTDRNVNDEGGSSDKSARKSNKTGIRQPETTYGVSVFMIH